MFKQHHNETDLVNRMAVNKQETPNHKVTRSVFCYVVE